MIRTLAAVFAAVLCIGMTSAQTGRPKDGLSDVERKLLELVNAERKKADLSPLKSATLLVNAARSHSENMAKQDTLAHELDGKGPEERLADLGYKAAAIAENCAVAARTPEEVTRLWMNSEGHKANMLGENYTQAGIGTAKTAEGKMYWTMVFATPAR
jgi:uncharacterized protein YkwD